MKISSIFNNTPTSLTFQQADASCCRKIHHIFFSLIDLLKHIGEEIGERFLSLRVRSLRPLAPAPLDLIAQEIQDERALRAIQAVRRALATNPVQCAQAHDNHVLHIHLTDITDRARDRQDHQQIWRVFLQSMQGLPLRYPFGRERRLDLSMELARLDRVPVALEADLLNPTQRTDLEAVSVIDRECFSDGGPHFGRYLSRLLQQDPQHNGCILVRNQHTREILGYLAYCSEDQHRVVHIISLGRRAGAAKLGIGDALFARLFQQQFPQAERMVLEVRSGNAAAQRLYGNLGFIVKECRYPFYSYPDEVALVMERVIHQPQQQVVNA